MFVHSRKATSGTLNDILNIARNPKETAAINVDSTVLNHFTPTYDHKQYGRFEKRVRESRNKEVQNLFNSGMVSSCKKAYRIYWHFLCAQVSI